MEDIPKNIELEKLPGSRVNGNRTMYFRDQIIYSPNKEYFALAYSINEVSNGNEVGFLSWGEMPRYLNFQ